MERSKEARYVTRPVILGDQQDIHKAFVFMTLEATEDLTGITHKTLEYTHQLTKPIRLHLNEADEVVAIELNGFRLADTVYGEI